MRRLALLSTWYKDGVESLARAFLQEGLELVATGNTKKMLQEANLPVMDISDLTGEPERFGGRVKTLHHKVLGAILFRPGVDDAEWPFDYRFEAVVCNFYPFKEKSIDCEDLEETIEWVDIGGPTMVRAAAKNFAHVYVFTNPGQYTRYIASLRSERTQLRKRLAYEAFELVADLDEEIRFELSRYQFRDSSLQMKYGENPHQVAEFTPNNQVGLKCFGEIGFNNVRDAEAAFRFVKNFRHPAVAVIKHQTLCGAAASKGEAQCDEVFHLAWEGDTVSRFGGVLGFNFTPTQRISELLEKRFVELIVAPKNEESLRWADAFHAKKPRTRILLLDPKFFGEKSAPHQEIFKGALGCLRQMSDHIVIPADLNENDFLKIFGQWASACSKSNAIVLCGARNHVAFVAGAGQGQPNRVEALEKLAIPRAQDFCRRMEYDFSELLCVSDAFLPFPDVVQILANSGVKRLLQPGGSKADAEVESEAHRLGVHMELTGVRHFWH